MVQQNPKMLLEYPNNLYLKKIDYITKRSILNQLMRIPAPQTNLICSALEAGRMFQFTQLPGLLFN
jgi:hypothetical protein